ncbi:ribonuclease Z [Lacinutrix sp. C3R15]|uniref:ribonuclease Z n=1 Tax=Flavobacteriaceae TaxID=49546 RepID=UPI001C083B4B|nr:MULTISPECIES: ribonuclease Z [Flavobacteriaceae]MBU2940297.1 ribonuclease Z [Lacinutrix sp. C3R15]MDO6623617.1 ribonuclease Z [Oceanihabitans sp. 1_MG-2023]
MIFDKDENITIITQEKASIIELVKKLNVLYKKFKNDNVIVNLTSLKPVTLEDIIEFLQISNTHRKAKKSFVIVTDKINLNETPDEIVVVPTIKEAYDIIEMEEMERDLGF